MIVVDEVSLASFAKLQFRVLNGLRTICRCGFSSAVGFSRGRLLAVVVAGSAVVVAVAVLVEEVVVLGAVEVRRPGCQPPSEPVGQPDLQMMEAC